MHQYNGTAGLVAPTKLQDQLQPHVRTPAISWRSLSIGGCLLTSITVWIPSVSWILTITLLFQSSSAKQCVSIFNISQPPSSFDICRTKNCFILRKELPYDILDDAKSTHFHARPFLCSDYGTQFSGGITGAFFDVIVKVPALKDAYCVWGGNDDVCSFNGMLKFLKHSAEEGNEHRWIARGLLFVLEYRISPSTIPSATLIEDQFRIIGPPVESYTTPAQAAETIVSLSP